MKRAIIISSILCVLFTIADIVFSIWTLVSFLIYLVKDIPFTWWVLWSTIMFFILMVLSRLYLTGLRIQLEEATSQLGNPLPSQKKSRFMQRLEEKMKENEQSKNK